MYHLLKHKKGQSTVEYIIILTVIVSVVLIGAPIIAGRYQAASDTASTGMVDAAAQISGGN